MRQPTFVACPRRPDEVPADAVWLITGCSTGIGREIADLVLAEGYRVVVTARKPEAVADLVATHGERALAVALDVTDLRGNLGRQGAGACPVRGHSNVQGDRTMGVWEKPDADFLEKLGGQYKFTPPTEHGLDTVDTIHAMAAGRVKVFVAMGGNFVAAAPDSEFTASALRKCDLTVQISTKLNRSHVVTGEAALILPVLGRSEIDQQAAGEQFVTIENSMGVVSQSRGHLQPASQSLKSEVNIIAEIAEATVGPRSTVKWRQLSEDYDIIRDGIGAVVPGFEDFNYRLVEAETIELPHAVRDERRFVTATQKANFSVHPIEPVTVPEGHYLMMTIRSHDQFNTTVYTGNDRYRGIVDGRMVVFMHPDDIQQAGLRPGAEVTITSHHGGETRCMQGFAVVPYQIPLGCVATYYPETNPLIPVQQVADGSNTPAYKSVVVSLR